MQERTSSGLALTRPLGPPAISAAEGASAEGVATWVPVSAGPRERVGRYSLKADGWMAS
ncbi:MAG: hypothetical protein ABL907_22270 [Hyphomicrobium sp.]